MDSDQIRGQIYWDRPFVLLQEESGIISRERGYNAFSAAGYFSVTQRGSGSYLHRLSESVLAEISIRTTNSAGKRQHSHQDLSIKVHSIRE